MRYVQRDPKTKEIIAHFANEQSYAHECIPEDAPELEAFRERFRALQHPPPGVRVISTAIKSPFARGLIRVLAKQMKITEAKLILMIKAEAKEPYLGKPGMGGRDAWEMEEDK